MASLGAEHTLFVRKATGLVKGWSAFDGFVYSTLSINLITLGLTIFASAPFIPDGGLIAALLLGFAFLIFQCITYASLVAVMPRAGGDYVWISRVLGGGLGFVLAATGWWFILWHWVPIYAAILNEEVLQPIGRILGWTSFADFWGKKEGIFVSSLITAALASIVVALGLRMYARVQKTMFYIALVGLALVVLMLLFHSKADFISGFNANAKSLYGSTAADPYHATLTAGTTKAGYTPAHLGSFDVHATFLLIPMLFFFNLWSNWGATLYGEVRGASDFRKNLYAMGGALMMTTIAAVILLLLFAKTFGWSWYNGANNAWWSGTGAIPDFPYPAMLAAMLTRNAVLQLLIVGLMSFWFFAWVGSVFLSSTRVVFAAAFDRVLPEWAAKVDPRSGVPWAALALMLIPSIPISYFYAYNSNFHSWTLDATLVIAITFLGSAIAAGVLPWRKPDIYNASPIAKYRVLGLPLITAAAIIFIAILVYALYEWWRDSVYGVNDHNSLIYMLVLYLAALVIYGIAWFVRRRQGMGLDAVYKEIPAE
jgi:amino acid transporter